MRFNILTLVPEFFDSPLSQSILGRAISNGLIEANIINIREHSTDKHRRADDSPYGGGAGMVMMAEPVAKAIEATIGAPAKKNSRSGEELVILLTPQGKRFDQNTAKELSKQKSVTMVCGRYEGFDERIRGFADMELSIGDYVLTGGEAASLVIMEATARLVPGVIKEESLESESFSGGLLEYPQYTRPEEFRGEKVPEVLLGGNHAEINRWRKKTALQRTLERRPELVDRDSLTEELRELLDELEEN